MVSNLTPIASNQIEFPILVRFTLENFSFENATADGHDLRFTAADGTTLLSYERERHDAASGVAEYWIKLPELYSMVPTEFFVYYRQQSTADGADPANVWDSNFVFVHHLEESAGSSNAYDSTINGWTATQNGTLGASGYIDGAFQTPGKVVIADIGDWPASATLELWFKADSLSGTLTAMWNGSTRYALDFISDRVHQSVDGGDNSARYEITGNTSIAVDEWHYVSGIYGSDGGKIYLDGNLDVSSTNTSTPCEGDKPNQVSFPKNNQFSGIIDEVRMSRTARSADWLRAQNASMRDQLLNYGPQEEPSVPPTVDLTSPLNDSIYLAPMSINLAATVTDNIGPIADVVFYDQATVIGNDSSTPYTYTWNNPTNGMHSLTAYAEDGFGNSGTSSPVNITVWDTLDIGSSGGSANYDSSTFTVTGKGEGITDNSDEFRFIYLPVTGDCTIIARVTAFSGGLSSDARAGIMMRQGLEANAIEASSLFRPRLFGREVYFHRRSSTGGPTTTTSTDAAITPYWVKLVRSNTTPSDSLVTAYGSTDGVSWVEIGTEAVPLTGTILVGLAVTSGSGFFSKEATIDSVSITKP